MIGRTLHSLLGAGIVAALSVLAPPPADANVRFQSHRYAYICRVVITAETPRGRRILFDGAVRSGDFKTFFGGESTQLCVYRSSIPENCRSRLTAPRCVVDRYSNRTSLFSIR